MVKLLNQGEDVFQFLRNQMKDYQVRTVAKWLVDKGYVETDDPLPNWFREEEDMPELSSSQSDKGSKKDTRKRKLDDDDYDPGDTHSRKRSEKAEEKVSRRSSARLKNRSSVKVDEE